MRTYLILLDKVLTVVVHSQILEFLEPHGVSSSFYPLPRTDVSPVDSYDYSGAHASPSTLPRARLTGHDFAGSWESITGHQAALYDDGNPNSISTNKAVQYFKSQGISPDKLVIGEFSPTCPPNSLAGQF